MAHPTLTTSSERVRAVRHYRQYLHRQVVVAGMVLSTVLLSLQWSTKFLSSRHTNGMTSVAAAWSPGTVTKGRRAVLADAIATATVVVAIPPFFPDVTWAQPVEFKNIGTQAPLPAASSSASGGEPFDTTQFTTLPNGVRVKDYSVGSAGGETVGPNSQVSIQCSGRLLNLNGVIFYNTKNNNPDGFGAIPLTFQMGRSVALPGLEAGLVGMRKNGVRRIIVPSDLAYSQFPDLEPRPMTDTDRRALDSVVKNPRRDATILFDVRMERFK